MHQIVFKVQETFNNSGDKDAQRSQEQKDKRQKWEEIIYMSFKHHKRPNINISIKH